MSKAQEIVKINRGSLASSKGPNGERRQVMKAKDLPPITTRSAFHIARSDEPKEVSGKGWERREGFDLPNEIGETNRLKIYRKAIPAPTEKSPNRTVKVYSLVEYGSRGGMELWAQEVAKDTIVEEMTDAYMPHVAVDERDHLGINAREKVRHMFKSMIR